ncbi:MAG TPA: DsrE/DsrF/DrsH-like family protein [Gaiellaceae bacterium]|nr:DsrE/DsrF/DrsH-like family protein [Gaiellaceae bacterium]
MLDELKLGGVTEEDVRRIVREELERARRRDAAAQKAAIIASKGTLDFAYPPLILATTAAASGMEAHVFFTFYGLDIVRKDFERKLRVSPLGNPAMPMPLPIPSLVQALPGMGPAATALLKAKFRGKNVATIRELLDSALELGVHLIACEMTMEVFGYDRDEFLEGVEFGGAAAFLSQARRAHVTLFV